MKTKRILLTVFIALSLCLFISVNALATESIPFELIVVGNDNSTAKMFCSTVEEEYELIICKNNTKDYQIITDSTPFFVDLEEEYSVCFKMVVEEILYYYDGYIIITLNGSEAVLESSDFLISVVGDTNLPNPATNRYEIESNNTYTQADRTYDDDNMYGRINPSGDVDWFVISFSSAGSANFWLGEIPTGKDYDLYLYASNGTTLLGWSQNGGNANELITYNVSANTDYYVKIVGYNGSYHASAYYLFRAKNYPNTTPVWSLNRSSITFSSATAGYGTQSAVSTTISNTGSVTLTSVSASITSGSAYFEITSYPSSSIGAGSSSSVNVRPTTGCPAGTYNGNLRVSTGNGGYQDVSLSFTVYAAYYSITVSVAAGTNNMNRAEFYTTGAAQVWSSNTTPGTDPALYDSSGTRIADDNAGAPHWLYNTASRTSYYAGTWGNTGTATYTITSTAPITLVRNGLQSNYSITISTTAGTNNAYRAEFYTAGAAHIWSSNTTSGTDPVLYNSSGTRIADDEAGYPHWFYTTVSGTYYYAGTYYSNIAATYTIMSTAPITLVRNAVRAPGYLSYWESDVNSIYRWATIPSTIGVIGVDLQYMNHAISQWNSAFGCSMEAKLASSSAITFFGGTLSDLVKISYFRTLTSNDAGATYYNAYSHDGTWYYGSSPKTGYLLSSVASCVVDVYGNSSNDYKSTATHELGHALGWDGHTSNTTSVMYKIYNSVTQLTNIDKRHLQQVY